MTIDSRHSNDLYSPQDWIARWSVSLTIPLYSVRRRNEIRTEMRAFARRMPEYHATAVSGILYDVIFTLPTADPFKNLYRDETGVIRLPGGEAFGTWRGATDLMPASNRDIGRDVSLSPMADALSDESVEVFFHASGSLEDARDYVMQLSACSTVKERKEDIFDIVEDAIRWALLRRQAYGIRRDEFLPAMAPGWGGRATRIVNGERFDEARMWRVRTGAEIPEDAYEQMTGSDASCASEEPECTVEC